MKQNWIKFVFERNIYVINLDCITSFVLTENGRLIFWLPDGKIQIIIHSKNQAEIYQKIVDYIENIGK